MISLTCSLPISTSWDFAESEMPRRILARQVGWYSIEAERGHSRQPTWRAKMRRGISLSAKSQEVEIGCTSGLSLIHI